MSTRLSAEERDRQEASALRNGLFGRGAYRLAVEVEESWKERDAARAESVRLRETLWNVYTTLGFDTDGDKEPHASSEELCSLLEFAAKEMRADYDNESRFAGESVRVREALRALVAGIDASMMELPEIITGWVDEAKIVLAELESETP